MPDQDKTTNTNNATQDNTMPVVPPLGSADMPATTTAQPGENVPLDSDGPMKEIANKISGVHNVLVALSSDPSVDEIAAAIGLSICLDRMGKRATSIYSGKTPNALAFLKPEETFQTSADALRDFVIALDKNKADHLRYKLDGEFVKIYITPYKTCIDEDDLEFSYGDFNIEFVLALNVPNGIDLDEALREHGRVMHDASVANITAGNPGKFGDIEWSDKSASSVSEMAAKLLYSLGGKEAISSEEATAFLTGIVSATDHFSNAKTTATTLQIASELMKSGADRQLIADNISLEADNMFMLESSEEDKKSDDTLAVEHEEGKAPEGAEKIEEPEKKAEEVEAEPLPDLQAVADGLTANNATTPETPIEPLKIDTKEVKITPSADFVTDNLNEGTSKYGQMLEEALNEAKEANPAAAAAPVAPSEPEINGVPEINYALPTDEILPPPPTPPIDFNNTVTPPQTPNNP